MDISLEKVKELLEKNDNFYILTHQYPDGDTLGSSYALCRMLQKIGKKAKVLSDKFSEKYSILCDGIVDKDFLPKYIISVDVADAQILGNSLKKYENLVDLSIDHHVSGKSFSKFRYIESSAAATAEIIYKIIKLFNVKIDKNIATCSYTGISTDTGCFKYANATSRSYRMAADMLDAGIDASNINRLMFDTKTRSRLEIERMVLDNIEFHCGAKCAVVYVTLDMIEKANANDSDLEGLASLPRQIEGVLVGVTLRQNADKSFKISVRTDERINSSEICQKFGGGGHQCAAGCTITASLENAKNQILDVIKDFVF